MGDVLVGTASWTDKTLIESGWYPPGAKTAEKRLQYYASIFPLVEVDSTYYFPPSESNSERWAERTPDDFTFNVKAFSLLTGHPTKRKALFKDMEVERADASGAGGRKGEKSNLYLDDLKAKQVDEVWDRFLGALRPLYQAGKLGALLFQYPQWFVISRKSKDYILECAKRAAPYTICVEFRNKTWMSEDNQRETLEFLEGYGIPYVCVDMPQGFTSSIPPVVAATADLGVVRFHGRASDGWESGDIYKRFGYRYSKEELEEWVPRIEQLSAETHRTHVLLNNCYRDYAQQNAKELAELLHSRHLKVRRP